MKRTYTRKIKKLKHPLSFARKPKNLKKHIRAKLKLYSIALKIYNDLVTQLNPIPKQAYMKTFNVLHRVITQEKDDKNKIYSIHV